MPETTGYHSQHQMDALGLPNPQRRMRQLLEKGLGEDTVMNTMMQATITGGSKTIVALANEQLGEQRFGSETEKKIAAGMNNVTLDVGSRLGESLLQQIHGMARGDHKGGVKLSKDDLKLVLEDLVKDGTEIGKAGTVFVREAGRQITDNVIDTVGEFAKAAVVAVVGTVVQWIVRAVLEVILQTIEESLGVAIGGTVGGALGTVVPVVGNIIGAGAGSTVGWLIGALGGEVLNTGIREIPARVIGKLADKLVDMVLNMLLDMVKKGGSMIYDQVSELLVNLVNQVIDQAGVQMQQHTGEMAGNLSMGVEQITQIAGQVASPALDNTARPLLQQVSNMLATDVNKETQASVTQAGGQGNIDTFFAPAIAATERLVQKRVAQGEPQEGKQLHDLKTLVLGGVDQRLAPTNPVVTPNMTDSPGKQNL